MNKKYIFKAILADQPVRVVTNWTNGFYADLLEECGVWHMIEDNNERGQWRWLVDYPLMIKHGESRFDLEVGDVFTLSDA